MARIWSTAESRRRAFAQLRGLGLSVSDPRALPAPGGGSGGGSFASFEPGAGTAPAPTVATPIADVEAEMADTNGQFPTPNVPGSHCRPSQMGTQGSVACNDFFLKAINLKAIHDCVQALGVLGSTGPDSGSMADRIRYIQTVHRYAAALLDATNFTCIGPGAIGSAVDTNPTGFEAFFYRGYGRQGSLSAIEHIFDWLEDRNGGTLCNTLAYVTPGSVTTGWAQANGSQRGWVQGCRAGVTPSILSKFASGEYRLMIKSALGADPSMSIADPKQISASWARANVSLAMNPFILGRPGNARAYGLLLNDGGNPAEQHPNNSYMDALQGASDHMQDFLGHAWSSWSTAQRDAHGFRAIMEMTEDTDVLVAYYADITHFPGFSLAADGLNPHAWGGLPAWMAGWRNDSFGNRWQDNGMMWAAGYIYSGARMVRVAQNVARQLGNFKLGDYMQSCMNDYFEYLKPFAASGVINMNETDLAAAQRALMEANVASAMNGVQQGIATAGGIVAAIATAFAGTGVGAIIGAVIAAIGAVLMLLWSAFQHTYPECPVPMMKRNTTSTACDTTGHTIGMGTSYTNILKPFITAVTTPATGSGGTSSPPPAAQPKSAGVSPATLAGVGFGILGVIGILLGVRALKAAR